jgi:hypothetical protein
MELENAAARRNRIVGVDHGARDRSGGGGARPGFQAGKSRSNFFIGSPQHGQATTWGGLTGAACSAPTSSGRPVWKAMRSRLIFAAGWQKPW